MKMYLTSVGLNLSTQVISPSPLSGNPCRLYMKQHLLSRAKTKNNKIVMNEFNLFSLTILQCFHKCFHISLLKKYSFITNISKILNEIHVK